jgi:hypothetical protein
MCSKRALKEDKKQRSSKSTKKRYKYFSASPKRHTSTMQLNPYLAQ